MSDALPAERRAKMGTACAVLALIGVLLLWLRRIVGLWVFIAAQMLFTGVVVSFAGLTPPLLIGTAFTLVLAVVVLQRRRAFA